MTRTYIWKCILESMRKNLNNINPLRSIDLLVNMLSNYFKILLYYTYILSKTYVH